MKLLTLMMMQVRAGKVIICSHFRSHEPYINIHDAYGLCDKLITATWAVEMHDAKMCEQTQATNVLFLKF